MSAKLSAKVRRLEARIRRTHEGVVFELTVMPGLLVGNVVELTWIIVQNRKHGIVQPRR
jgi:hypothetical protein